jgi:predicted dehydrogenase
MMVEKEALRADLARLKANRRETEATAMNSSVAVVGCGRWGAVHVASLLQLKQEGLIKRVIACDLVVEAIESIQGVDAHYTSWQSMCEHEAPNLVILATPNETHTSLGMAFLAKGLHVLIEKPFGASPIEAQALLDTTLENQAAVFSGHLLRHHAGFQHAKHLIENGTIGQMVSATYERSTVRPRPPSTSLIDGLASHGIDGIAYLFPGRFDFSNTKVTRQMENQDAATFVIGNKRSTATIAVGWGMEKELRSLCVIGSEGKIEVDFGQHTSITLNGETINLKPSRPPLQTQVLAALHTPEMTPVQIKSIFDTAVNVEEVKLAMSGKI